MKLSFFNYFLYFFLIIFLIFLIIFIYRDFDNKKKYYKNSVEMMSLNFDNFLNEKINTAKVIQGDLKSSSAINGLKNILENSSQDEKIAIINGDTEYSQNTSRYFKVVNAFILNLYKSLSLNENEKIMFMSENFIKLYPLDIENFDKKIINRIISEINSGLNEFIVETTKENNTIEIYISSSVLQWKSGNLSSENAGYQIFKTVISESDLNYLSKGTLNILSSKDILNDSKIDLNNLPDSGETKVYVYFNKIKIIKNFKIGGSESYILYEVKESFSFYFIILISLLLIVFFVIFLYNRTLINVLGKIKEENIIAFMDENGFTGNSTEDLKTETDILFNTIKTFKNYYNYDTEKKIDIIIQIFENIKKENSDPFFIFMKKDKNMYFIKNGFFYNTREYMMLKNSCYIIKSESFDIKTDDLEPFNGDIKFFEQFRKNYSYSSIKYFDSNKTYIMWYNGNNENEINKILNLLDAENF